VYENANRLGAERLSDSPRARLRFDAAKVATFVATASSPSRPKRAKPRKTRRTKPVQLLPVAGETKENQ
jgi:hypothetical protein